VKFQHTQGSELPADYHRLKAHAGGLASEATEAAKGEDQVKQFEVSFDAVVVVKRSTNATTGVIQALELALNKAKLGRCGNGSIETIVVAYDATVLMKRSPSCRLNSVQLLKAGLADARRPSTAKHERQPRPIKSRYGHFGPSRRKRKK
jgi:hypothetical protein